MIQGKDKTIWNKGGDIFDAVVVGSGPNGLAAAINLVNHGLRVLIVEAKSTVGGGMRSRDLMISGVYHDVCSAIHPLAYSSPFFQKLPLEKYGLEWVFPSHAAAHPLENAPAAILDRSVVTTAHSLLNDDEKYLDLVLPFLSDPDSLLTDILAPIKIPKSPIRFAKFGFKAIYSASDLINSCFKSTQARAFFAGMAAHAIMPLEKKLTSGMGLVLALSGHINGWPFPKRGAQSLANALLALFLHKGGSIYYNHLIKEVGDIPSCNAVLFDLTPRQVAQIMGDILPKRTKQHFETKYRYGAGTFKIDFVTSSPIPWKDNVCSKAGTVHLGGSFEEIASAERSVYQGKNPSSPFVLVAQHSLFDPSRVSGQDGLHTVWAYCHVAHRSNVDMSQPIINQIERFAPGFKKTILQQRTMCSSDLEAYNPNYIGGDINGGMQDIFQHFARPRWTLNPYKLPVKGAYICSSSTPPGGGVHGMCGYWASMATLKNFA